MEDERELLFNELETNTGIINIPKIMLYNYYVAHGHANYILQYISHILIALFMTGITIVLFFLDWSVILYRVGEYCNNIFSTIDFSFNISMLFMIGNLISSILLYIWFILHLIYVLPVLSKVKNYIHNELCIDINELYDIKWDDLVRKANLNNLDIRNEICKNDNILLDLIKNNKLDLNIYLYRNLHVRIPYTILTNWMLKIIISTGSTGTNKFDINLRSNLKKFCILFGILSIIIMPFTYITVILYFVMKQCEQLHAKKDYLGPRSWTQYSKSLFRKYNELPHEFDERLYIGSKQATNYLNIFIKNHGLNTIMKMFSFMSGGILTLLTGLTIINDNVLINTFINGRNLLSYLTVFASIFALVRMFIANIDCTTKDPKEELTKLCNIIEYRKDEWINREHLHVTYKEVEGFYRYRFTNFLREIMTFILIPYIFLVIIPRNLDNIVESIKRNI